MGDRRCTVKSTFCFHLLDDMFQHFFFICIQIETAHDQRIAFSQFGSSKTDRDPGCFCMVFDQMHNGMEAAVDSTTIIIYIAQVHFFWLLLIFGNMNSMLYQFIDTFIFSSRNRNDWNTKHFLHLVYKNGTAIFPYLIHHI